MAQARTSTRSARGTISQDWVVEAALADCDGFDAVTMRAITAEVGANGLPPPLEIAIFV